MILMLLWLDYKNKDFNVIGLIRENNLYLIITYNIDNKINNKKQKKIK